MNLKKKVAIIEDNRDFREALEMVINFTEGMENCGSFENTETAFEEISKNLPDVVLVDINLPQKNGIEAVSILKQKYPKILFLMCTSYDEDEKIFDSLKAGAIGYILKVDGPTKIIEAIKEVFDGGSPMTSSIARKVVDSFMTSNRLNKSAQILTSREIEILESLSIGLINKEIADKLFISTGTVKKHIQNIYEKLHVNTRIEAVNKFFSR